MNNLTYKHALQSLLLLAIGVFICAICCRELFNAIKNGTTQLGFSGVHSREEKPVSYWVAVFLWLVYLGSSVYVLLLAFHEYKALNL
jgi:hypothetical protein